jgi:hypothetical protein
MAYREPILNTPGMSHGIRLRKSITGDNFDALSRMMAFSKCVRPSLRFLLRTQVGSRIIECAKYVRLLRVRTGDIERGLDMLTISDEIGAYFDRRLA